MLDLKLIYILLLTFTISFSILIACKPSQFGTYATQCLKDPSRRFTIGLINIMVSVLLLYTSLYFFPNLTFEEIIIAITGAFIGLKGVLFLFLPEKLNNKLQTNLQSRLALAKNISIILSILFIYVLINY